MFSPLTKRPKQSSRTPLHRAAPPDSPVTPASHNRESANRDSFISDRPATGTPAPWAPRLSVLARYPDPSLSLSLKICDSFPRSRIDNTVHRRCCA